MTGLDALTLLAAVGCGVVAGVFFAFSTFVIHALERIPAPQAVAAMQSINVSAVRPAFMTALFGTAAACAAVGVRGVAAGTDGGAGLLVTGAALYLLGTTVVTVVRNVPLNNALAELNPNNAETARAWQDFVRRWTAWNHVRTGSSLGAAVLLTLAFIGA